MTTKKRVVYQFLALTVNPIQNYVSCIIRKFGSQTGTSKVGHVFRVGYISSSTMSLGTQGFSSLHPPAHCAYFKEGWFLSWF